MLSNKYIKNKTIKIWGATEVKDQLADIQRDARQDRLEIQETLRAIMERLPPAAGPFAAPPAPPAP
jgi:hypothetical protein